MTDLKWPYEGLPIAWEALFVLALTVIVVMFAWSALLFVRGRRAGGHPPPVPAFGADGFTWVFMVPALNEEVTIRDSVERLLRLPLAEKRVIVVDDASDDRTPEILAEMDDPDLFVIRRDLPDARRGKAAALNLAYRALDLIEGRAETIVAIVDADGRLHPAAPRFAASHFADREVGGVQSLVRIYNKGRLLTWMQDVEFSVYGHLFQAGRDDWGTAGMGGNGQFNRLSALDDVFEGEGPWRDRLTEDQDLGLRLIAAGWKGRQDLRAEVAQQGPPKLGALYRQRTRWSQGNLRAIGLLGSMLRAPIAAGAKLEVLLYLLMPVWQGIVGAALAVAVVFALTGVAPFWAEGPTIQLAFFYLLAVGGTILGAIASRGSRGVRGWVGGFLLGHLYAPYTWLLWPVLARSTVRMLVSRSQWAKTERVPITVAPGIEPEAVAGSGR